MQLTWYFFIAGSSSDVKAEVGTNVVLPCRVDTAQCGDLHSVKWYRDNQRVYVFSHVAGIARPEGDGSDRLVNIYFSSIFYLTIIQSVC